jgi:hypothetical protein
MVTFGQNGEQRLKRIETAGKHASGARRAVTGTRTAVARYRDHKGRRAGAAMDSPLPGCPLPAARRSSDDAALGAGLAGASGAAGAGCAPTRPTAMVVIEGNPPPGLMLEPYTTSVPGVQPTRNSTVIQTPALAIAVPSGGEHGISPAIQRLHSQHPILDHKID